MVYRFPGKYRGPHSIELGNDGNMWFTLCISGEMAKFDLTDEGVHALLQRPHAGDKRGAYPHTLRINPEDPEGLVWYTDAGLNSCFSLHPETLAVKHYQLLEARTRRLAPVKANHAASLRTASTIRQSMGSIWYSKLNGNRIGRIDPERRGRKH